MSGTSGRRLPPELWEVLAAAALLGWRFQHLPGAMLFRDWVSSLAVFWIVTALAAKTKAWPAILGLAMALLFALYAVHQVPHSLAVLGALR